MACSSVASAAAVDLGISASTTSFLRPLSNERRKTPAECQDRARIRGSKCDLTCGTEEFALRWQLLLHLIANLLGDLCKRSLVITWLVVEDDSESPYGSTG
jgi:hypothetical protein